MSCACIYNLTKEIAALLRFSIFFFIAFVQHHSVFCFLQIFSNVSKTAFLGESQIWPLSAIGVDDMFIMNACWEQTLQTDSVSKRFVVKILITMNFFFLAVNDRKFSLIRCPLVTLIPLFIIHKFQNVRYDGSCGSCHISNKHHRYFVIRYRVHQWIARSSTFLQLCLYNSRLLLYLSSQF